MSGSVKQFWQSYLDTLPPDSPIRHNGYVAEGFGDSPEMAEDLGRLIASGVKTATCSAYEEYVAEDEPLPEAGDTVVILDGDGEPLCIIETTEVTIRRYDEVDEQVACDEGEGDRTLAYWRREHEDFFGRVLPRIGGKFTTDMPLVCERFRVVWPVTKSPRG